MHVYLHVYLCMCTYACVPMSISHLSVPMQARKLVCACDACMRGRYESCSKVVPLGGQMKRVAVTVTGDRLNQPQLASLEEWSKYLAKGTLFGVNSDPNERREGFYWLAQALGPAYPAPANMVHATDQFEVGLSGL